MELKLDKNIKYAIALDGGGAKGGYEVGVWKALDEAGIEYEAVSGTSVGALNGALFAMRDLRLAVDVWSGMELTSVISVEDENEEALKNVLAGRIELDNISELFSEVQGILKNRGLDTAPLKHWIRVIVDAAKIGRSDVALYVTAFCMSDMSERIIKINELPEDEIYDMLLASAYHPAFKQEELGGKFYMDGGFVDKLPIWPLVRDGYKNIIAVHLPGWGRSRRFKMPGDVSVFHIETERDLGAVLNFDKSQSLYDMKVGYYDAKRLLYGLYGKLYYIERTMSEKDALNAIGDFFTDLDPSLSLRTLLERKLPYRAIRLGVRGDYYDLFTALMEEEADKMGIEPFRIIKDTELWELVNRN